MKLLNMVPVLEAPHYKLISLIDDFEVTVNKHTIRVLKEMQPKLFNELNKDELFLAKKLMSRNHLVNEPNKDFHVKGTKGLQAITVEITDACNLRCKHCYLGEKKIKFLSFENFKKIADSAEELGAHTLTITGGEPFLDPDIFNKLSYARELNLRIFIISNATMITTERAEKLSKLKIARINVSLNGFKAEHEYLYGHNTFDKTIKNIRTLIDTGNNVFINFNKYSKNAGILKKFEAFCKKLGIKGINVSEIKNAGWAKNTTHANKKLKLCCGKGGKELLVVKATGDIIPCVFLETEKLGNIYETDLVETYLKNKTLTSETI